MHENSKTIKIKKCPLCGNLYCGVSALSRTDNQTPICPDCGTRQALESIGVNLDEREQILKTIHRAMGE